MSASTGGFRIVRRSFEHPDAVRLVAEVQAEYIERYGSPDEAPIDAGEFDEGRGAFLVGYLDEGPGPEPVATGAWRWVPTPASLGGEEAGRSAELKRMFVRRTHRRRGLASLVLARIEAEAAEAGVRFLVLETGSRQPEAMAMYVAAGYRTLDGFGHYAASELAHAYVKDLAPR